MSTGVAARAAALLGLGTLLVLAGMWLGHDMATTQAQAAREKAATVALQRYQQAVADGQQAVGAVQEQLRLQKSYSATLDERQRHAPPLTVPLPRCPRGVGPVVADGAAGPAAGAGPAGAGEGAAPGAAGPGVP
ncbi:MAG: hypothetical protein Q8K45_21330, partial [Rubrivivax sp.]|nr:hypothetical protein [Rubrivivax sp.]